MNPSRVHYADLVAAGLFILSFALIPALDSSNGWLVAIPGIVGGVASFLELRYHQGRLCERCMASFPLDAANAAERSRLAMRVAHLMVERPKWHWYLGMTVIVSVTVWAAASVSVWVAPVVGTVLVSMMLALRQHSRLQPWCPYCGKGGGGGDEEESPVTPPTPSTSK